ncbi:Hat2p [Sugiyamaella lignohabitans]|uniref:Hat2p n=1 Tax=Sugiyamaella lignohabitans TaxID=796027 RepID=A0A167CJE8_9ASCO|nr:Hat2p [Sugiyamaella lignohabitans]ANB11776.1 Hat2p [Sugiyamaella lignohabitans]
MLSSALPWPSLTVEWFPDVELSNRKTPAVKKQRLLLGTRTAGQGDEFLRIADTTLPDFEADKKKTPDLYKFDSDLGEVASYTDAFNTQVNITQRINHNGEINRARFMPQNPNIIATLSSTGATYVFDRSKHSLSPGRDFRPDISLNHHKEEGYGLCWNTFDRGLLLTGSGDSTVALWDVNQVTSANSSLSPKEVFKFHTQIVNEVEWHPFHSNLFGSVSDDSVFRITDIRSPQSAITSTTPSYTSEAINTLAFNLANEYLIATGSSSKDITLWDTRKIPSPLHNMSGHTDGITSLQWSPHFPSVIASASPDKRVIIWDIAMMGEEQTPEEAAEGPPELLFVHGGHTDSVFDISWNPDVPWMMASVADDNQLHIWRPSSTIVDLEP